VDLAFRLSLEAASTIGDSARLRFLLALPTVTGLSLGLPRLDEARLELGVTLGLFFFLPPFPL